MFEKLDKIPRVGAAGYDSGRPNAPDRCLEDTRTVVLDKIWCWIGPPTPETTDKPAVSDTAIVPISGTLDNPPQVLPLNLFTGSTDLRGSESQQLPVRLLKMRNVASCWVRASSSLVRRRSYQIHTFLFPPLHINLPGETLRRDQSS